MEKITCKKKLILVVVSSNTKKYNDNNRGIEVFSNQVIYKTYHKMLKLKRIFKGTILSELLLSVMYIRVHIQVCIEFKFIIEKCLVTGNDKTL